VFHQKVCVGNLDHSPRRRVGQVDDMPIQAEHRGHKDILLSPFGRDRLAGYVGGRLGGVAFDEALNCVSVGPVIAEHFA
jgi:hypothetical protein